MTDSVDWRRWLEQHALLDLLFPSPVGLPQALGEQSWAPTNDDRDAAQAFLIQLNSRIATRPLPLRSGVEVAALESLYKLFDLYRDIATKHGNGFHFATLALQLLNERVRPFTDEWHRRKGEGDLASVDVCVVFRAQLARLQCDLRKGAKMFAAIAGVAIVDAAAASARTDLAFIETPVRLAQEPAASAPRPAGSNGWADIFGAELEEIRKRRTLYGGETRDVEADGATNNGVGLALSGGGIRSATFSLGVVTELARRGILRQVDYLSTVSGGGYLGGYISTMLGSTGSDAAGAKTADVAAFGDADAVEAKGPRALRNHSKYLLEGGLATIASVVGTMIHGVATSLLLVAPTLIALAVVLRVVALGDDVGTVLVWGGALGAIAGYVLMTLAQKSGADDDERTGMYVGLSGLAVLLCGAVATSGLGSVDHAVWVFGWLTAVLIATVVGMLVLPMTALLRRALSTLFSVLLFVLAWSFVAWLVGIGNEPAGTSLGVSVLLAAFAAGIYFFTSRCVDLNQASPHRYYRSRLAATYLLRRDDSGGIAPADVELSALNASGAAPLHLVCAAVNLPGSRNVELRGRRADFFVFSKRYCGSPLTGYARTSDWEATNPRLTLATAIAVSGAAAAPNMGMNDASRFRHLLALLNVRLSYWLRKPDSDAPLAPTRYFRLELLGRMHEKLPHLCVSDGGHMENLGVYELLRRRCKFIISIDGEADPGRSFGGLLTLVQLARIDLGVKIEPDLANLRGDAAGIGRSHFEQFRIDYGNGDVGLMLYVKASMTGNESEFLRRYRRDNPAFPHESTAQQLYSERQFEAYRSLGEHIAGDLFREDLVGQWSGSETVMQWFRRLAEHLLPPNR